jgi:hypothetical protein
MLLSLAVSGAPELRAEGPGPLGEIKAGAPLAQKFRIVNPTTEAVKIGDVKVSCGCTQWSLDRDTIPAGGEAVFSASINTLTAPAGPWSWTATVNCRGARESQMMLRLSGTIIREIAVTPPGLSLSFETSIAPQSVTVSDRRAKPLAIGSATSSKTYLKPTVAAKGQGEYIVTVTVADDAPDGDHDGIIALITDDATYPVLRIPVNTVKRAAGVVSAHPDVLSFNGGDRGKLILRRSNNQPIRIERCEIADRGYEIKWTTEAHATPVIAVKRSEAAADSEMKITLAEPAGQVLRVPVRIGR